MSSSHRPPDRPADSPPRDESYAPNPLGRRRFLRAGMVAGAAGVTAVAASPAPAQAADGDPVQVGEDHIGQTTTGLAIEAGTVPAPPTLTLANDAGGAQLRLEPHLPEFTAPVDSSNLGELFNTDLGPLIVVETPSGPAITYIVTGEDLDDLPTTFAAGPRRALDTRNAGFPPHPSTPAGNRDATGRIRAGSYVDVDLGTPPGELGLPAENFVMAAAHLNVTATAGLAGGYLTVCGPGPRPNTSTLNFTKGQTIANAAFTPVSPVAGVYVVRVYASAPVHVVVDFCGGVQRADVPLPERAGARRARSLAKVAARARRLRRR